MDFFLGITTGDWFMLLKENRFAIGRSYWKRAAFVTFLSLLNTRVRKKEEKKFGSQILETQIKAPLFIVGHWRSGTTLLHNLFALDPQFAYPNLFQVTHPHTFLHREAVVAPELTKMAPRTRPMDNMLVTFNSPGEDESAIAQMSFCSPLIGWSFQKSNGYYDRYLTFQEASQERIQRWKDSSMFFYKKLAYRYGKSLVLKSPINTARIRLLVEMFPDARFVHVYRNPFRVFQSTRRLHEKMWPRICLQNIEWDDLNEKILDHYQAMYEAFFAERCLIPAGQFCEVCFEEFEKDKIGGMEKIYASLNLDGYQAVRPKFQEYISHLSDYKKNVFDPLPEELVNKIAEKWHKSFSEWGYDSTHAMTFE